MFETKPRPIGELFEQHQEELFEFLSKRVGKTDAQDLVQETFARIMRRGEDRPIASPLFFLRKIAGNLARDHSRRRKFEASWLTFPGNVVDAPAVEETPAERLERAERARLFRAAVAELPPRCRDVFVLCFVKKMPAPEIAQQLGISDSMVRRHLRLALARCREAIKK